MSFSDDMATASAAIIAELGGDAVITRTTTGVRDPVTRTTPTSTTTIACKAVMDTRQVWNDAGHLSTETVLTSATEALVGDLVAFAGKTLRVIKVGAVAPAGVPILFEAVVQA